MTSDCVNKVKRLFETDASKAREIDARMREAAQMCEGALLDSSSSAQESLRRALELAASCFTDWDLTEGELGRHMKELKSAGALAVKPTGSGGGGFALSLWDGEPQKRLRDILIPIPRPEIK
jgi:mevalonate kinase